MTMQHHSSGEQSFGNGGPTGTKSPQSDPTFLTTQQLLREMESLKDLVFTRLDAMDKAMELFNANITRVPTDTDKQISHLKELHDEKFEGIEKQFKERDVRTEQSATATKIAVDAALQAQKEAAGAQNESNSAGIAKSETATTKQIDGITALLNGGLKALDEKINDLKGRLDRGEGQKQQVTENKGNQNWFVGLFVIGGLSAISIIVGIVALLQHMPLK